MKDDYLWDKSGEADPEIEHLERVLGSLHSQSSAKDLMPAFDALTRKRPLWRLKALAIAATLAFAVLALGTLIGLQRQMQTRAARDSQVVMVSPVTPSPEAESTSPAKEPEETRKQAEGAMPLTVGVPNVKSERLNPNARRRFINRRREAFINEREQAEGLMAKEQLIKALEITSSKLSVVQKKVRGDERQGPSS
jgi:hypothetical protein